MQTKLRGNSNGEVLVKGILMYVSRRVKRGAVIRPRGRRECSTDAARNLVEKGLVQDIVSMIVRAAISVRQAQGKTQRRTHKHKAQNNTQEQD